MQGQTLIEVLVALAIAVVVSTSITILSIASLSNAQFVRDQDQATKYAQEGMEVVRALRNKDYLGFKKYNGTYCLDAGQTSLGSAVSQCTTLNINNKYIRSVVVKPTAGCGTDLSNVLVSVVWTDSKCTVAGCHASQINSCLSTKTPVPAL